MLQHDRASLDVSKQKHCVICQSTVFHYAFKVSSKTFQKCEQCNTILPENVYYNHAGTSPHLTQEIHRDSDDLVEMVYEAFHDRSVDGPCLVVSTMNEKSLMEKLRVKLSAETTYKDVSEIGKCDDKSFGKIILLTPLTMIADLNPYLQKVRTLLKSDGCLSFIQPMIDSSQSKLIKRSWLAWNQAHTFYPTRDALHILLLNSGFDRVWFRKARYSYSLDYIARRFKHAGNGIMHKIVGLAEYLPGFLRKLRFKLPSSHIIVTTQLAMPKIGSTLSIILPVYNEKNTFEELIQTLLAKNIEGLRKEIIMVESNSTDGTKELVKKYADHPDIRVIWQEQPQGKGFAVREGLAAATGDYVLIQDADLEYDINDYDSLLVPLRESRAMFVLGSRHTGTWRMREFDDAATTAALFNIGHLFFTWLVNILTHQRMTDPFTMFKVFRRDVLFGLDFYCKRFDFDHEMVIKFIRKGYQPLELPVNYRSRSFAEGKKVSFLKDGLFWITTDLKLRFGHLGKWPH